MIYPTKRIAQALATDREIVVPAFSEWEKCHLGCACIRRPTRVRIGWAIVLA